MITIQIIDDHRVLVEGLKRIINASGVARVVGTAGSVRECKQMLSAGRADVLLLDVHLPDGNGLDLCIHIRATWPEVRILALSSYSEYATVSAMLANGADGYILKNAMPEEVLQGVQSVAGGEKFLCEKVDLLLKRQESTVVKLTRQELELLRLICEGYTNVKIAKKMYLAVETINSYRKNLLFKLNANNTAALVKKAIEERLI
ncbi:transcriptional regulatory protein DevR (DosR) [Bacteroidia bacterium]|nr:transcriptional regulatory protein DevR (DosR) [Bacteroidia bacterium]